MIRRAHRNIARSESTADQETDPPKPPDAEERIVAVAEHLARLGGIGVVTAWTLAAEIFAWRDIRNRR